MFGNSKEKQLAERIDQALADDVLSDDEQQQLFDFARSLGLDFNAYLTGHPNAQERVVIAMVNAGRLPDAKTPYHILVRPGEKVYVEGPASALKSVADRQWQGGYGGFSFRIAKGVRYRVGQTQGHIQQVGTKLILADGGMLSVTSSRVVFSGQTSSHEIPLGEIIGVTVFAQGVTPCLTIGAARQTGTYAVAQPHLFAAVITAAAQPHLAATDTSAVPPPPPSNVGLISDDGAWRWDGTAWQPVKRPPAQ